MILVERRSGQILDIADGLIQLHVMSIRKNSVQLGIQVPTTMKVFRHEILKHFPHLHELPDAPM